MRYSVEITAAAENDLDEIVCHIAQMLSNPNAARDLLDDFLNIKSFLVNSPQMFPLCTDEKLKREGYRRFLFKKNFVALYLVDEPNSKVTIMRIFYAKRDYEKLL